MIADADGQGIGTYNFGAHEQTSAYMGLLSGETTQVVEGPRASLDATGAETDTYELFAGVPRADSPGIVQISLPANSYEQVLSAASLEHLGDNYTIGTNGGIYVIYDGIVVTSTDPGSRGVDVSDVVEDMGFDEEEIFQTVYDSEDGALQFASTATYKGYQLMDYQPTSEVYAERGKVIQGSLVLYLVLYAIVFVLVSRLLSRLVITGIKQTNATLGRITAGDLDQRVDVRTNAELDELSDGINTTVTALKESIAEANARIDRELATAHAIQLSALPRTFPPFPEITAFDIYASMNPAREVGGDFYDFFLVDDHTLGFVVADVSGKGIPAALFMMTAKTEIENYVMAADDLSQAVATVNHRLCVGNDADMFATAFIATFDFTTGLLTYVNAGHNPPLLRHGGTWEWLREKSGLFLGAMDDRPYRCFTKMLAHDDELLLYTDGVTEAWNADDKLFGEGRLIQTLQRHAHLHPTQLVYKMENILADFAHGVDQADDITMLALEYGEAPDVSDTLEVDARTDQLETVLDFVHEELARRLCPLKAQKQLDIALEELFVNVAHYAYPQASADTPGKARITYTYSADPPCITVELSDCGVPYDPLKKPDPQKYTDAADVPIGGLGIMMAKRSVDDIDYRFEHGHNIITFSKRW